jgi:hypothetical protein
MPKSGLSVYLFTKSFTTHCLNDFSVNRYVKAKKMRTYKIFEKEGFEALNKYRKFNSLPESDIESLAKVASEICQFPVSFMCLTDFKSHDTHEPLSGKPHIIFYAFISLMNSDDLSLTHLSLIDKNPRNLNDTQISALKILAEQISNLIELRKLNNELLNLIKHLN